MTTTNTYAYIAREHDCDGITDSVYSVDTFAQQSYYDESEAMAITRAEFVQMCLPHMDSWSRKYWRENGYHGFGHKVIS